jgi:hypothetical protein
MLIMLYADHGRTGYYDFQEARPRQRSWARRPANAFLSI